MGLSITKIHKKCVFWIRNRLFLPVVVVVCVYWNCKMKSISICPLKIYTIRSYRWCRHAKQYKHSSFGCSSSTVVFICLSKWYKRAKKREWFRNQNRTTIQNHINFSTRILSFLSYSTYGAHVLDCTIPHTHTKKIKWIDSARNKTISIQFDMLQINSDISAALFGGIDYILSQFIRSISNIVHFNRRNFHWNCMK